MNITCRASAEAWGLEVEPLEPGEAFLTNVQGGKIPLLGKAQLTLKLPSRNIEAIVQLVVADTLGLPELIIGWVDLQRWGILRLEEGEVSSSRKHGVFAVTSAAQEFLNQQTVYLPRRSFKEIDPCDPQYVQKMEVACSLLREQLIRDVPLAFSDRLESHNIASFPPVHVSFREGMEPVKVYTTRPFPLGREDKCKQVIQELIDAGTICEFHGHSDWVSPAFFVRKGLNDVRMVCNLRKLNLATNRYAFPGNTTESIFQQIEHSARVLITMDLLSAYYQLSVAEEDQNLLTFLLLTG